MANKTVTVKTSGGDYTSLNAALSGESTDLVNTLQGILTIECYSMSDTTTANTGTGYTTDSTHYINIVTPASERHDGKWNTSKYRLETAANAIAFTIQEAYTRVIGLQIAFTGTSQFKQAVYATGAAVAVRIASNIIKYTGSAANSNIIETDGGAGVSRYIYNNILYGANTTGSYGMYLAAADGIGYVENNTVYNCTNGIRTALDDVVAKNNLVVSCTNNYVGTFAAGTDYNATDDASLGYTVTGGGNTHDVANATAVFVNAAGADYHLAAGDSAIDAGTSSVNCGHTDDIDGVTRTGTWDIGADEYVAAGGGGARYLSENIGVTDSTWRQVGYRRSSADNVDISDATSKLLFLLIQRIIAESVDIPDSAARSAAFNRSSSESIGITDYAPRFAAFIRSLSENVDVADARSQALLQIITRIVSDSVSVSDATSRVMLYARFLAEDVGQQDAQSRSMAAFRFPADQISVTDALSSLKVLFRAVYDTIGLTDAQQAALLTFTAHLRSIADTVGVSDLLSVVHLVTVFMSVALNMARHGDFAGAKRLIEISTQLVRSVEITMKPPEA